VLWLQGNHTANYRSFVNWKEVKAALGMQVPDHCRNSAATVHITAPKEQRSGPSAEQMDLGEGCNHVVRGRVLNATNQSNPVTNLPSQTVMEVS
jgi:hypothetical protein